MTLDLNGEWYFAIDQDPEYHRHDDYSRETSLRHWEQFPVPGCWNRYAERYDLFEGVAWFVREFELPVGQASRLSSGPSPAGETETGETPVLLGEVAALHFGGVNYRAEVFLNGQRVGEHEGGYTAFALDVTEALREGKNRLAVRVDNRHLRMRLPAVLGWYNYGGIHRGVTLRITEGAQIAAVQVRLAPTGLHPALDASGDAVARATLPRAQQTAPAGEGAEGRGARGEVRVEGTTAHRREFVGTNSDAGATGTADSGPSPLQVTARLYDPAGAKVWEGESEGPGPWVLPVELKKAEVWSPESPALYRCEVELSRGGALVDSWEGTCGVRKLEVGGAEESRTNGRMSSRTPTFAPTEQTAGDVAPALQQSILLNGESVYLRGMCYLYDHPSTGVTFTPEVVARDLDDLQALGVNCLRSHFPVPDMFLEECDRRGVMLWLEVPIYCVAPTESCDSAFAEASVQGLALQMLREMIAQAYNHPSVILWGVGNECDTDHAEAEAFFRACVEEVRAQDPTRLISYAALYGGVGCAADLVDVIGINEYWGWYDRIGAGTSDAPEPRLPLELPELEACLAEKSALGKPLLLTELGADAEPGFRSGACELWSEEYQALFLARTLEVAARFPAVCGTFPFGYADYRDPSKPIGPYWHGINLKGVVGYDRRRKLGWETIREMYRGDRRLTG